MIVDTLLHKRDRGSDNTSGLADPGQRAQQANAKVEISSTRLTAAWNTTPLCEAASPLQVDPAVQLAGLVDRVDNQVGR